ncbi:hypothetical protein HQQ94_05610 [Shewanella sp. VB17]|uniref:hypothetical protein n=1 Tax=Shewanella sp. VB17 TaxID=2739432 RepID=UPI00156680B5|nr:hypothetical protein [Shewanella sp. VB17]NRD72733.1 hypothetical protein [Shewanella sp. VB17]
MFNSIIGKMAKSSLMAAVLMGASVTANADTLIPTDLTRNIEQNITAQLQDMLLTAQRELSMSIQAQISSSMFDVDEADEVVQTAEKDGLANVSVKE